MGNEIFADYEPGIIDPRRREEALHRNVRISIALEAQGHRYPLHNLSYYSVDQIVSFDCISST